MKKIVIFFTLVVLCSNVYSQTPRLQKSIFDLIDLEHPGLEAVRTLHSEGKELEAAEALLKYYRER